MWALGFAVISHSENNTTVNTPNTKTTLLLIPGGSELQLPQNANNFKNALHNAITNKTAEIIMRETEEVFARRVE